MKVNSRSVAGLVTTQLVLEHLKDSQVYFSWRLLNPSNMPPAAINALPPWAQGSMEEYKGAGH